MKLGLNIGYSGAALKVPVELVQRAEELGYDSVWTAEAYGSDAVTPLAFLAGKTSRIKLGTAIIQLAARTPAKSAEAVAASERAAAPRSVRRAALPASGERLAPPAQRRSPPAAERRTTPPDEVLEILAALPRLGSGEAVELRFAAEALRKARLLTRNGSSTRLFKRHADWFVLAPGEQPNSVRYRFAAEA